MKGSVQNNRKDNLFEDVLNEFLFHCKFEKGLCEKTIKAYKVDCLQLQSFVSKYYNIDNFENITKDILKNYIQTISSLKPKTTKRKIASMKALFSFYEYDKDNFVNPIRKIKIRIQEPRVLPTVMQNNEVEQILRYFYEKKDRNAWGSHIYIESIRNICIIELLFATGIRVSELCGLRCNDIDLINGSIKVNGKGSKERMIHICSYDVINMLKEYYSYTKHHSYFFINRLGNRLSEQSVRLLIKKCIKELRITKKITPHTFRHTFATLLLESGVDIKYIQTFLGHSSIVTTQIYTHVNLNMQRIILQNNHPRNGISISQHFE